MKTILKWLGFYPNEEFYECLAGLLMSPSLEVYEPTKEGTVIVGMLRIDKFVLRISYYDKTWRYRLLHDNTRPYLVFNSVFENYDFEPFNKLIDRHIDLRDKMEKLSGHKETQNDINNAIRNYRDKSPRR